MLPTVDNSHVAEGRALLTDHFRNQTFIPKLQAVYLRRVQELENAIWQVINTRLLVNNPTGDVLTKIGTLVGQPRGVLDDANLLFAVKLRIRANKSDGLSEDIIQLAALISPNGWEYIDEVTAGFTVQVPDIQSADIAQSVLTEAKAGGVAGSMIYTTWADGSDFEPDSSYDSSTGELGFGSVYDASVGGLLASVRDL